MELDEKEREKLRKIESEVFFEKAAAEAKKRQILREGARKRGTIANKLEDLKSESGEQFIEIESGKNPFGIPKKIKAAVISGKTKSFSSEEVAYLCRYPNFHLWKNALKLEKDPDTCGWVKGFPEKKWYDEIGPLSGSNGWRYTCRVCGNTFMTDE